MSGMEERRFGRWGAGLALALLSFMAGVRPPAEGLGPAREVERTWRRALVMVDLGPGRFVQGRMDEAGVRKALGRLPAGRRLPSVVYVHGCAGLGRPGAGNYRYVRMLAEAGYFVVAPDSFARAYRPPNCDPKRHRPIRGAPHDLIARMRQEEIRYAARRMAALPWVDRENLFLMGHSQGGTSVAAYRGGEFRAVVASGSVCQRGVLLPSRIPLLAMYSEDDPWRRSRSPRGCAAHAVGRVTPIEFHLFPGRAHNQSRKPEARRLILEFLARHRAPVPGR